MTLGNMVTGSLSLFDRFLFIGLCNKLERKLSSQRRSNLICSFSSCYHEIGLSKIFFPEEGFKSDSISDVWSLTSHEAWKFGLWELVNFPFLLLCNELSLFLLIADQDCPGLLEIRLFVDTSFLDYTDFCWCRFDRPVLVPLFSSPHMFDVEYKHHGEEVTGSPLVLPHFYGLKKRDVSFNRTKVLMITIEFWWESM